MRAITVSVSSFSIGLFLLATACTQTVGDVPDEATGATVANLDCLTCTGDDGILEGGGMTPGGLGGSGGLGGGGAVNGEKGKDDVEVVRVIGKKGPLSGGGIHIAIGWQEGEHTGGGGPSRGGNTIGEEKHCENAATKCFDPSEWLEMCLTAAASQAAFQTFINLVFQYSVVDYIRLKYASGKGEQERINMCYGVYT